MKQAAGLVLALTAAAPAIAGDGAPDPQTPRTDPEGGAQSGSFATELGGEAALSEGRRHLAAGNAAQAISAFRQALATDQASVAALNGLGIAYDRLGRHDLARRQFETALSLEPDAADIAYNLGYSLHLAGSSHDAVPWLQRASGGDDGRAADAARRLLAVIAAQLEAEAAKPLLADQNATRLARAASDTAEPMPARVLTARIDMASSGEAVLVLPSEAGPQLRTLVPPVLALSVPVERVINAALPAAPVAVAALDIAVPEIAPEAETAVAPPAVEAEASAGAAPAAPALAVRDVMASRLGALAALTIPLAAPMPAMAAPVIPPAEIVAPPSVVRAAARATLRAFARPQPALAVSAAPSAAELPRVITLGDAPPDFSALSPSPAPAPAFAAALANAAPEPPPLRLLDLAALPLLATATPLAPMPLLAPPRIAVDWLSGTDIDHLAPEAPQPAYKRLMDALLTQVDLADAVDRQAVRMAITRLEALVARIQSFSLEVMRA